MIKMFAAIYTDEFIERFFNKFNTNPIKLR